ncbi:MAG: transposase [Chitinophagales bacterium]
MNRYNPKIHHRRSIRLKGYDYSQSGFYFITICCQHRAMMFGEIKAGKMYPNEAGKMIAKWYYALESKFPDIRCREMVVMPNHFHCIIENIGIRNVPAAVNGGAGADQRVCPNNENVCPNNENVCPDNENVQPNNKNVCPNNENVCPNNENVCPNNENVCPNNKNVQPNNKNVCPNNENVCPNNENVCPNNENVQPDNENVCPNNEQHINDTGEHINDTGEHINDTGEHINDTGEHINDTGEHINDTGEHINDRGEHVGSPLSGVVQWFKTMTTNEYIRGVKNLGWQRFDGKLWQRNYWERIVRNKRALHNIARYIINNPANWREDGFK